MSPVNMENSLLSQDSLGSELDMLRQSLKQKERELADKEVIISSLRQRENDMSQAIEELENNEQLTKRTIERLTKEVDEKNAEIDAISHALKEVESAYETLNKRTEAKTTQLKQFVESLAKAAKELEEARDLNKHLQNQTERLSSQVSEMALDKKRMQRDFEQQIEQLKQQLAGTKTNPQDDRNMMRIAKELRFTIADEMEDDIMESGSALSSLRAEERAKPESITLATHNHRTKSAITRDADRKAAMLSEETKSAENQPTCVHRQRVVPPSNNPIHDPIAEFKMRMARANELARRNKQTKPLHQTSYPLELDTFDTTDITEQEIKHGNIVNQQSRVPQRAPPPLPSQLSSNNVPREQRQALSNCSNTPPVARRVYKKAEAFIV